MRSSAGRAISDAPEAFHRPHIGGAASPPNVPGLESPPPAPFSTHEQNLAHVLFVVAVLGLGLAIGYINIPDAWYRSLQSRASRAELGFAPAWSILYVMIELPVPALSRSSRHSVLWPLWLTQMILNFLWSPLFFGLHQIAAALVVIFPWLRPSWHFIAQACARTGFRLCCLCLPCMGGLRDLLNGSIFLMN